MSRPVGTEHGAPPIWPTAFSLISALRKKSPSLESLPHPEGSSATSQTMALGRWQEVGLLLGVIGMCPICLTGVACMQ